MAHTMRFLLFLLLFPAYLSAQTDSLSTIPAQEDLLESYLQGQEEAAEFEYNDLFENLAQLRSRPLNLNRVTESELEVFPFLSDLQKISLLEYRRAHGDFISIYELQAVPNLDVPTIRQLIPYVKVKSSDASALPKDWLREGQHQIMLRWGREIEERRGYTITDTTRSRFLGDRNALYMRYRFSFSNRISFGLTAEKDAGEEFFTGSNRRGFDFYSAHFFYQNPKGRLKNFALGDFNVAMGQGLILFNGFAPRKSPLTTSIKRNGSPIRRYSSVNEIDFFRGAGATYALGKNWDLTAFFSTKQNDGNIGEPEIDPDTGEPLLNFISSLQNSGRHRTPSEVEDENSIRMTQTGGILRYRGRRLRVSGNALFSQLDQPLQRDSRLYNRYFFNGRRLFNSSVDYQYTFRNYHVFGETAMSDNGAIATTNGLLVSLERRIDMAILHRQFPENYQALNAQPFAETTGGRNERGTYIGMAVRPAPRWEVNAYFDLWKHDWLRSRADAPSAGNEWLLQINYAVRRKMNAHIQIRNEIKNQNQDAPDGRFDRTPERQNLNGRIHFAFQLNPVWEWRTRVYAGMVKLGNEKTEGTALFQDLIYRSKSFPLSFSTRFAIFDTGNSSLRFYAYENDVLYSFSIPSYSGRGTRFYLNARWKIRRGLVLEARYARTDFTDRDEIGDGLERIEGNTRSDFRFQLRMSL